MFQGCLNLKDIKIVFEISKVKDMSSMFDSCISLLSIDLSRFNTLFVENMSFTFSNCISITSLDLFNFYTPKLTNIQGMFNFTQSLKFLNIINFNTSNVINMGFSFYSCSSITSLDLSNFDTSNVFLMSEMFSNCSSLKFLNLSSFKTEKTINMAGMFYKCKELISLDLSNFNTTSVMGMSYMFSGCNKLISLDLSNFNTLNTISMENMFDDCINLEYINFKNFIEGTKANINNIFNGVPNNLIFCINNEEQMPQILGLLFNKNCTINDCSNNWNIKQKKIIDETNICVNNCSEDNTYNYIYRNKCYSNCPNGTRLMTENNNFLCINDCPENLSFEINYECINDCNIQDFLHKLCVMNNKNINAMQKIINKIRNELFNKNFTNSFILNQLNYEKEDLLIEDKYIIYQITTTYNQNKKEYNNTTTINIGECENILRKIYNIYDNETLIIFKIDYFLEEFLIPITEYEIFHPQTKEKLDLNHCNKFTAKINIPVSINENEIFKYDPNSRYYNDKCFPYTSDKGTDITLNDRKIEYNIKNLSLCEKDCEYIGYDKDKKNSICYCKFKNKFKDLINFQLDKEKLLNKFIDFRSTSNKIQVIKCIKTFFSINGIKKNIGSYILMIILIINGIEAFIFYKKGFKEIKDIIQIIIESKKKENQKIVVDNNQQIFNNKNKNIKIKRKKIKHKSSLTQKKKINLENNSDNSLNSNNKNNSKLVVKDTKNAFNLENKDNINIYDLNNKIILKKKN